MSIVAFDLDDTLCSRTQNEGGVEKYHTCYPLEDAIEVVNNLHDLGFEIVVYTARGMSWFKGDVKACYDNLYDLTHAQLVEWGVKFDRLVMGKMHYDVLIDDKTVNPDDPNWKENLEGFL